MVLISDPRLRRLLNGLLLLAGCRFFTIYPKQRDILRNRTSSCVDLDESYVITMDAILSDDTNASYANENSASIERIDAEHLSKTTFLDFSTDLECRPKQLMAMLDKVDSGSRLVRVKVVPHINCQHLIGQTFKFSDARLDTMFVCRREADPTKASLQLPEYGLVWDTNQYAYLAPFNDELLGMKSFLNIYDGFSQLIGLRLLFNDTDSDIKALISRPYCPDELKRQVSKPATSQSGVDRRRRWLILVISCPIILTVLFCCCRECLECTWFSFSSRNECEQFELHSCNS